MKFFQFRKPVRIHANGHSGDLLLTDFASQCGDLRGPDAIGARFEDERGGFVLSYADLKQAVRAIEIERRYAKEEVVRRGSDTSSEGQVKP